MYSGKHQEMALGRYPNISLFEARKKAEEARVLLIQGINPMEERKERKKASDPERTFGAVALRWWEQQKDS